MARPLEQARAGETLLILHGSRSGPLAPVLQAVGGVADTVVLTSDDALADRSDAFPPSQDAETIVVESRAAMSDLAVRQLGPHIDGVMTVAEDLVPVAARIAADLGLPGLAAPAVSAVTDKAVQRRRLAGAGVPCPPVVVLDRAATPSLPPAVRGFPWPGVLKPRRGSGSTGVATISGPDELVAGLAAAATQLAASSYAGAASRGFVLEGCLAGDRTQVARGFAPQVSVESLVHDGQIRHLCVTDRLDGTDPSIAPTAEAGLSLPTGLAAEVQPALLAAATAALRAVGFTHGMAHTELMLTVDGPRVIEVNGRPGGAVARLLELAGATNPLADLARISLGRAPAGSYTPTNVALLSMIRAGTRRSEARRHSLAGAPGAPRSPGPGRPAPGRDAGPLGGLAHLGEVAGVVQAHQLLPDRDDAGDGRQLPPNELVAVAFGRADDAAGAAALHRAIQDRARQ